MNSISSKENEKSKILNGNFNYKETIRYNIMKISKGLYLGIAIPVIYMFLCMAFDAYAEEIKVKSFSMQMDPMTVPMQRKDNNGNICALVKVIIPSAKATFEGSLIGDCDFKTSEYWCYLAPGSKHIKVKYPGCEPLLINFESLIGTGVKGSMIYELVLSVPVVNVKKGEPLQLAVAYEKPSNFPFNKDNQRRFENDRIEELDVYLNLKDDGSADDHIIVENKTEKLGNILIGNVEAGDVISIVPRSKSFQPENIKIEQEHLDSHKITRGIYKKRGEFKCRIQDAKTGDPINGVTVDILDLGSYWVSTDIEKEKKFELQKKAITDSNGNVSFKNGVIGFTYGLAFSDVDGYLNPGLQVYHIIKKPYDVKFIENNTAVIEFEPTILKGTITDGKKVIPNATISCNSLYGEKFNSDNEGNFNISGYKNNGITVSAPGYKTLILSFDEPPYTLSYWDGNEPIPESVNIRLKKGSPDEILHGKYDNIKKKIVY